jgi:hypothetical protein
MTTIDPNTRFHCQWPEGYENAQPKDVDAAFFRDYNAYDDADIARIARLAVGETCVFGNAQQKHTVTRMPDAGHALFVQLDSVGNPDYEDQEPGVPMPGVPTKKVAVQSLAEASAVCREYLDEHDLGGGNWSGGLVTDEHGTALAEISYNGRIWPEGCTPGNAALFERKGKGARP